MAIGSDPIPPRPFRWTKEQYQEMYEMCWFVDKHVELIAGEIIEDGRMTRDHWVSVNLVTDALWKVLRPSHYATIRSPIDLETDSEPHPDAAVFAGNPRDDLNGKFITAGLIIEVADQTLVEDRHRKGSLYAQAGVEDYWIVNLRKCGVERYRNPIAMPHKPFGFGYETAEFFCSGDRVSPLAKPEVQIAVADLLP